MSAEKYRLKVTAGPSYDVTTHTAVPVNTSTPFVITTPHATTTLHLRLQHFRSSRASPLPSTHSYFTHPDHLRDLYSFQLHFTPSSSSSSSSRSPAVPGDSLVFGNDFSRPIRAHLPIGFGLAWKLAKWIDPGLQGDVYADEPWIYGGVLSSMNVIRVTGPGTPGGSEVGTEEEEVVGVTEVEVGRGAVGWGGDEVMVEDCSALGVPGVPETAAGRRKFFLEDEAKRMVCFEKGYTYGFDFCGPWLDFNAFQVKLPGFTVNLLRYWDGQPVRYVLKNKHSGEVYAVIVLDFVEVEDEDEDEEWGEVEVD